MASDTLRDLLAAEAAGCEPHLVLSGRAEGIGDEQVRHMLEKVPRARVHSSLAAFADHLLERDHVADRAHGSLA
jgi:D-glycero-D-manno-heptose 1,7-bisphosphate phosphatase